MRKKVLNLLFLITLVMILVGCNQNKKSLEIPESMSKEDIVELKNLLNKNTEMLEELQEKNANLEKEIATLKEKIII